MLKAIIFDFDGVITDSEILHFRTFNEVLATFGFQISKPNYYQHYLGLTDKDCFQTLIDEGHLPVEKSHIPELVDQKKKIFQRLAETEGALIEGVRPFLEMLVAHRVLLGVCSGALLAEIEYVLNEANIRRHFTTLVAADHVCIGKPHPEGYRLALANLHEFDGRINASNTLAIEDARWGLAAARAAGLRTLAVTNSYPEDQLSMADSIVDRLDAVTMDDLHRLCP